MVLHIVEMLSFISKYHYLTDIKRLVSSAKPFIYYLKIAISDEHYQQTIDN